MNWIILLQEIFEVCLIPLLGLLTAKLIKFINTKSEEIVEATDNALIEKYVELANRVVCDCVRATNQTYTDTLKAQGAFTKEAQKEAFKKSYDAILAILSDEAKASLSFAFGDLEIYLTQLIEAEVNRAK